MSATTLAGLLLIVVPLAFNGAFTALASRFDYPDVLRHPTSEVLAKFRDGGNALVLLWWGFALTAVAMVPLVVLLSSALADADATLLSVATWVGVLAAVVQFLGLIRWPFLVPYLAQVDADDAGRRRRLPGLQPLPRRSGRRASGLPVHRRVDDPGGRRAGPERRGARLARRRGDRHRPGAGRLLARVRRPRAGSPPSGSRRSPTSRGRCGSSAPASRWWRHDPPDGARDAPRVQVEGHKVAA